MDNTGFLAPYLSGVAGWLYVNSYWWTAIGFIGNIMFGSRFVFQWLASERRHCLVVPAHFWYLSFFGSVLNLLYALHLDNAPLLAGVIALPFIYGRNIVLMRRDGKAARTIPEPRSALAPNYRHA